MPPTPRRRTSRSTRSRRTREGLIALTGGPDGPIDRALRDGQTDARRGAPRAARGDLRRPALRRDPAPRPQARGATSSRSCSTLAYALELPLVATNEVYFATPDDYEAHDALLCIAEGRYVVEDDRRRLTREHYFKSADEMAALFADLPEALANTIEIAKRCAFRPQGPQADPAALRRRRRRGASEAEQLARSRPPSCKRQAEDGLERAARRDAAGADGFTREDYEKRLAFEIDVITQMKFPGYFLIVADFIKWAKAQRHSGRAGPRLGRRLGRRLGAHHHRPRSAALRPAVRALPQPRARVDAGLRHRLLPGPPRRGDPLRAAASTAPTASRRSSPSASCRRAPCCATSAACCRCRTARSTGCASWCRTIRPIR